MIWDKRITLEDGTAILPEQVTSLDIKFNRVIWESGGIRYCHSLSGARFDRGMKHGEEWWFEGDRIAYIYGSIAGTLGFDNTGGFYIADDKIHRLFNWDVTEFRRVEYEARGKERKP